MIFKEKFTASLILLSLIIIVGCGGKSKRNSDESLENIEDEILTGKIQHRDDTTEVKIVAVRRGAFESEILSNGKAEAYRKSIIPFKSGDQIAAVYVKNGERVHEGDLLVEMDDADSRVELASAELSFEEAKLKLLETLYSEGIRDLADTVTIPEERFQNIKIRSGYASAEKEYEKAVAEYNNLKIYAPFTGIVADCELKPHNPKALYENVCTLIDDSRMEVSFKVMENEVSEIKSGMEVEITPYAKSDVTLNGVITEVNPKIDENGMAKIKCITTNRNGVLIDGMNLSILVKRKTEEKLIIPKSAVLPRQGRRVVFTYENGVALWKYVTVGDENSSEVVVESGLEEGEFVIYENNISLSHNLPVKVK